jgi:hypothetical protein
MLCGLCGKGLDLLFEGELSVIFFSVSEGAA